MTSFRTQPCSWELAYCGDGGTGDVCQSIAGLSPEMQDIVQNAATAYLWNITGRQFGTCPVTIRPCKLDCLQQNYSTYRGYAWTNNNLPFYGGGDVGWGSIVNPALIGGQWYNMPCGGCQNDICSCTYVPTIDLLGPVASVDAVFQDGTMMDPSQYRVDNYRYLVRTDGQDWPVCQDMVAPTTATNTLEVTYQIGVEVPDGGKLAAAVLACQMAKAACGDGSCQLPQRIHSVTRQQVSVTVLDSYDAFYINGATGLFAVDSWVNSVNFSRQRAGTRVSSPDRYDRRRTTWQA